MSGRRSPRLLLSFLAFPALILAGATACQPAPPPPHNDSFSAPTLLAGTGQGQAAGTTTGGVTVDTTYASSGITSGVTLNSDTIYVVGGNGIKMSQGTVSGTNVMNCTKGLPRSEFWIAEAPRRRRLPARRLCLLTDSLSAAHKAAPS